MNIDTKALFAAINSDLAEYQRTLDAGMFPQVEDDVRERRRDLRDLKTGLERLEKYALKRLPDQPSAPHSTDVLCKFCWRIGNHAQNCPVISAGNWPFGEAAPISEKTWAELTEKRARLPVPPDAADAARYRWLKSRPGLRISWLQSGGELDPVGELGSFDSTIDAAIASATVPASPSRCNHPLLDIVGKCEICGHSVQTGERHEN